VGMRMRAPQHAGIEHAGELHIIDKRPLASQQSRVLKAFQRLACIAHALLLPIRYFAHSIVCVALASGLPQGPPLAGATLRLGPVSVKHGALSC
jgi:hypothetical protein